MATLLKTLDRALGAIARACGEYPCIGLLDPVLWPIESSRPASTRPPR